MEDLRTKNAVRKRKALILNKVRAQVMGTPVAARYT